MAERFTFPITATDADIDELGHVSNLVYLRWVLDVAMAHTIALGWGHPEYRALGAVFVVRRHEIDYLAQVTAGQQIVGTTWIPSWKAASCIRATELARDGQLVARAEHAVGLHLAVFGPTAANSRGAARAVHRIVSARAIAAASTAGCSSVGSWPQPSISSSDGARRLRAIATYFASSAPAISATRSRGNTAR